MGRRTAVSLCLLAAGLLFWLWRSGELAPRDAGNGASGPKAGTSAVATWHGAQAGGAAEVAAGRNGAGAPGTISLLAAPEAAAPGKTPALENPATEADGFFEVAVTSAGQPVPAAQVLLFLRAQTGGPLAAPLYRAAGAAVTNAAGTVRLPARPGAYLLSAHAAGLARVEKEALRPHGAAITKVELQAQPGHALEGRTTTVGGKEPVPLASVTAVPLGNVAGPRGMLGGEPLPAEERLTVQSDPSGRFRFASLGEGFYRVEASAAGHARAIAAKVQLPRETELVLELAAESVIEGSVRTAEGRPASGAEVLAVAAGTTRGASTVQASATAASSGAFSLSVEPGTWQLSASLAGQAGGEKRPVSVRSGETVRGLQLQLGKPGAIAGTVAARTTGAPIAGAWLTLRPYQSESEQGQAVSDAKGQFALEGIPPGSYDVYVRADGFVDQLRAGLTVGTGQRFPLAVQMVGTGSIAGFVRDGGHRTVAGAYVRLQGGGGPGLGGPGGGGPGGPGPQQLEAITDPSGSYRIDGLRPGSVRLTAGRDEQSSGAGYSALVSEGQTAALDLTLADNGTLQGRVTRKSDGGPAAQVTVRAMQAGAYGGMSDGAVLAESLTDASGAFTLSVPPGSYRVFAFLAAGPPRRGGGGAAPALSTVTANQVAAVQLTVDDTVPGTVGSVVEPEGGPAGGAAVMALDASGRRLGLAVADASGHFSVPQWRSDPPTSVRARNGGRIGEALASAVGADGGLVVQLQRAAVVHGTVQASSEPPPSFKVTLSPQDPLGALWGPMAQASPLEFTGTTFDLNDAPGVAVTVTVTTDDGRKGTQAAALQPGQEASITVVLLDAGAVTGRVLSLTGTAQAGALVGIDGARRSGTTGADGRFQITGVAPGEHQLVASLGQRITSAPKTITVSAGAPLEVGDLTLAAQPVPPGQIGASFQTVQIDRVLGVAIGSLWPQGPAQMAGALPNDQVVSIDGAKVASPADAVAQATGTPGTPLVMVVSRGGALVTLQITRAGP
jgi:Carboxypeptidase regulatory-like domain